MLSAIFPVVLSACIVGLLLGCQLPTQWRPLSEGCRAELAEIIVYAKVLGLHPDPYTFSSYYNGLPYGYEPTDEADKLLYTAEVELLCDQAWGSMLEVPAGSRLNLTGLGYLSCQSHTVMENYAYIFFLKMDENYNILPHSVNYQDAIFPDTQENKRMFSSLFQFSNCSSGHAFHSFSPDWEHQEHQSLLCSSMQQVLFEEGERVASLQERVSELEKKNQQLKDRVRKLKRSLRKVRKTSRHYETKLKNLQQAHRTDKTNSGQYLNAIAPPYKISRHRNTHRL